jgi:hypothetical protein
MCLSTSMFAGKIRVFVGSARILLIASAGFPVIASGADRWLSLPIWMARGKGHDPMPQKGKAI